MPAHSCIYVCVAEGNTKLIKIRKKDQYCYMTACFLIECTIYYLSNLSIWHLKYCMQNCWNDHQFLWQNLEKQ